MKAIGVHVMEPITDMNLSRVFSNSNDITIVNATKVVLNAFLSQVLVLDFYTKLRNK